MAAGLTNPAFPITPTTFEGTAAAETLSNKPYALVHANEAGTVTVTFANGDVVVNVGVGEDINVSGATSITSSATVKIS